MVDVGLAHLDQLHRVLVELVEVVRTERDARGLPAQPFHVLHDVVDELQFLCFWIRVVEAQNRLARLANALKRAFEVQIHALCMTDVQIAVRLWRETASNLPARDLLVLRDELRAVFHGGEISTMSEYGSSMLTQLQIHPVFHHAIYFVVLRCVHPAESENPAELRFDGQTPP